MASNMTAKTNKTNIPLIKHNRWFCFCTIVKIMLRCTDIIHTDIILVHELFMHIHHPLHICICIRFLYIPAHSCPASSSFPGRNESSREKIIPLKLFQKKTTCNTNDNYYKLQYIMYNVKKKQRLTYF